MSFLWIGFVDFKFSVSDYMSIPQNVIFDPPNDGTATSLEDMGGTPVNGTIPSIPVQTSHIESFYDLKIAGIVALMYLINLIIQYICFFITVPFDEVSNRPNICIISSIYDAVMFTICCSIFPMGSIIPTVSSLHYRTLTVFLQAIGLLLSIVAMVMVLNVDRMDLYQYDSISGDSTPADVTLYIQMVTFFSLFFHSVGFILSTIDLVICIRGLSYLNNRIDRQKQNDPLEFPKGFPNDIDNHEKVFRG